MEERFWQEEQELEPIPKRPPPHPLKAMSRMVHQVDYPEQVFTRLLAIQNALHRRGFRYTWADPEAWPHCCVLMTKASGSLVVSPWPTREHASLLEAFWQGFHALLKASGKTCGLILVGMDSTDDPVVRSLVNKRIGSVAYVNPEEAKYAMSRSHHFIEPPDAEAMRPSSMRNMATYRGTVPDREEFRQLLIKEISMAEETHAYVQRSRKRQISGNFRAHQLIASICVPVFLAMAVVGGWHSLLMPGLDIVLRFGASYGPLIRDGQWWRLFTCMFVHFGFFHLFMNMMALSILGRQLEIFQGRTTSILLFILGGFTGSVGSLLWHPTVVSAGASGGIFGLAGATAGFALRHRRELPEGLRKEIRTMVFRLLGYNALLLFAGFIDHAAHAGGFLGGLVFGFLLGRSPTHPQPLPWHSRALAVASLLGLLILGYAAVQRIPKGIPSRTLLEE